VNAGFFYKSSTDREKLLSAERQFIDDRVQKVIAFKKKVCDEATAKDGKERNFVLITQKVFESFLFLLSCYKVLCTLGHRSTSA